MATLEEVFDEKLLDKERDSQNNTHAIIFAQEIQTYDYDCVISLRNVLGINFAINMETFRAFWLMYRQTRDCVEKYGHSNKNIVLNNTTIEYWKSEDNLPNEDPQKAYLQSDTINEYNEVHPTRYLKGDSLGQYVILSKLFDHMVECDTDLQKPFYYLIYIKNNISFFIRRLTTPFGKFLLFGSPDLKINVDENILVGITLKKKSS
jgi:hypothetical protein